MQSLVNGLKISQESLHPWGWAIIILIVVVVAGFSLDKVSCEAQTRDIGFPYRWSVAGGCQIRVEEARWIPLGNYRYPDTIDKR